jgi:hypothetical protein
MLKRAFLCLALLLAPAAALAQSSKLSNLTAGGAITGTDLFYDVQTVGVGGVKVTGTQLLGFVTGTPNTFSAIQTFSATNGIVYSGAAVGTQVACLGLDASNNVVKNAAACGSGGGAVTSVSNADGTLTISPTTGAVVASLALGHANTWSAVQTFSVANGIVYSGATVGTQVACIGLDGSNNLVKNAAACGLGTVTSISAGCGTSSGGSPITTTGTIFAAEVPNLRAGTTYTIANADCGTLNNFSNAAAIAVTLPQAGSGGNFANGWYNDVCSIGAGTATITPTTSTIGGVATLVLTTGKCARIVSDGTNYQVVTYGGGGGGTPGGAPTNVQFNSAGAFGGDAGFTYTTLGQVTIAGGTITTNNKALTITQTWNLGTTVFDAPALINVTNTLSDVSSRLFDVQGGGTSIFSVMQQASGGALARAIVVVPALSTITTSTNNGQFFIGTGMVLTGSNAAATSLGGSRYLGFGGSFQIGGGINTNYFYGSSSSDIPGNIGVTVTVYADDSFVNNRSTLAIANSTTASGLRVYNTTDNMGTSAPTNYERAVVDWTTQTSPVALSIGSQSGGTGSARPVLLVSSGMFAAAGPALPTCNTTAVAGYPNGTKGFQAVVSDATAPTYNANYTSGGAVVAHVVCNGTNWVTQ